MQVVTQQDVKRNQNVQLRLADIGGLELIISNRVRLRLECNLKEFSISCCARAFEFNNHKKNGFIGLRHSSTGGKHT
jgi:hypothetical protein